MQELVALLAYGHGGIVCEERIDTDRTRLEIRAAPGARGPATTCLNIKQLVEYGNILMAKVTCFLSYRGVFRFICQPENHNKYYINNYLSMLWQRQVERFGNLKMHEIKNNLNFN